MNIVVFEDLRFLKFFEPLVRFKGFFELPLIGVPHNIYLESVFDKSALIFLVRKEIKEILAPKYPLLNIQDSISVDERTIFISSLFIPEFLPSALETPTFLCANKEKVGFIENKGKFTCESSIKKLAQKDKEKELKGYFIDTPFKWISNLQNLLKKGLNSIKDKFPKIKDNVYSKSDLSNYIYINAEKGAVLIEENVKIEPFTYIEGPSFIGKNTRIYKAKIGSSYIGENCRIGGEIDSSIFIGFSNKAHEGFIGHSIIGEWVNLGALTTNSDLKNNYSNVRVQIGSETFDTGIIKFGAIIGEHTKTGIGTLIPTGAYIDCFCNLFGGILTPKYVPPFSWLGPEIKDLYQIDKAIKTARIVMKRRDVELSSAYEKRVRELFN